MNLQPTPAAAKKAAMLQGDRCAGTAFRAPSGAVLFVRRSGVADHPGEWAMPGGHLDPGETAEAAARREAQEELGVSPEGDRSLIDSGGGYTTFLQAVDSEFTPTLNEEHTEYKWAQPKDAPQPLHPGVQDLLPKLAQDEEEETMAMDRALRRDRMAFDRTGSVRTIDVDGRLHVAITNISKANICEYLGAEIPGAEEMGLDPKRLYKLLRDPEELEKGAATFNNLPLLSEHVPFAANDHDKDIIVGSTGTNAVFEAPYLKNSLVVWDSDAIDDIETGKKQELSCAYRYVADMTPGTYEGSRYDGVMREIRGNHVAIVVAGRAGSDVIVGDSQLKESIAMSKKTLSRKATLVKGALLAFLCPRLAADASLDLNVILQGVSPKNWEPSKTKIAAAIGDAVKTKKIQLATDASIDGLVDLLNGLDNQGNEPGAMPAAVAEGEEEAVDEDPVTAILAALKGKMPDEELAALGEKLKACFAGGSTAAPAPGATDKDAIDPNVDKDKDLPPIDKKAMDSAIAAAVKTVREEGKLAMDEAVKRAKDEMRATAAAEEFVKPFVGKLNVAFDSANAVYKAALEVMEVDISGVHESAYKALLEAQKRPGGAVRLGVDSIVKKSATFAEQFPEANRLKSA